MSTTITQAQMLLRDSETRIIGDAMAEQLSAWGANAELRAAALLLPALLAGDLSVQAVQEACGEHASLLCAQYVHIASATKDPQWAGQPEALRRTQCYIAAYREPDLAFLAVAHLWRQVIDGLQGGSRQQRQARELARGALAPFLDMLGMRVPRIELEHLLSADSDDDTPEDWRQTAGEIVAALTPHLPGA